MKIYVLLAAFLFAFCNTGSGQSADKGVVDALKGVVLPRFVAEEKYPSEVLDRLLEQVAEKVDLEKFPDFLIRSAVNPESVRVRFSRYSKITLRYEKDVNVLQIVHDLVTLADWHFEIEENKVIINDWHKPNPGDNE